MPWSHIHVKLSHKSHVRRFLRNGIALAIWFIATWSTPIWCTTHLVYYPFGLPMGVRDQFRLGGLRSVARIFSPLLARKSSGFARILHICFCPPPRLVRLWVCHSMPEFPPPLFLNKNPKDLTLIPTPYPNPNPQNLG